MGCANVNPEGNVEGTISCELSRLKLEKRPGCRAEVDAAFDDVKRTRALLTHNSGSDDIARPHWEAFSG